MLEGWVCPKCERVNSPFTEYCGCTDFTYNISSDSTSSPTSHAHLWVECGETTGGKKYKCVICGQEKTEVPMTLL